MFRKDLKAPSTEPQPDQFSQIATAEFTTGTKTEWRFNLERASWWGGIFELRVEFVKACLRKVLGNAKPTFDELLTVLVEIEGTLTLDVTYDKLDENVLTTSYLIMHGRRLQSSPDENVEEPDENENCSNRYRTKQTPKVIIL